MKWKFCEFCYINGHCENQDRGHKCECYGKKLEDKCERLEKQLNIAIGVLSQYAEASTRNLARCALDRIAEIDGDYSHYWEQQIKELVK